MIHPDFEPFTEQEAATPEQAKELLDEISEITLRGERYNAGAYHNRVKVEEMPSEIAVHLPQPDASIRYADSVYVTQGLDKKTGQSLQQGVAGRATFTRKERVGSFVYATHVNYSIVADVDGGLNLERHMTSSEDDAQEGRRRRMARIVWGPHAFALERLNDLQAMQVGAKAAHPVESAKGVFDVTKLEAQQVLEHVRGLSR